MENKNGNDDFFDTLNGGNQGFLPFGKPPSFKTCRGGLFIELFV